MKIKYNNTPSKYELTYIRWVGIHYDRVILKKFFKRFKLVKFLSIFTKKHKTEFSHMCDIIEHYGKVRLINLMNNDEHTSRISHIERLSRTGSIEILTKGLYNEDTYRQITNLPKTDFDLVTKRVEELINIGRGVTTQKDITTDNIPGT